MREKNYTKTSEWVVSQGTPPVEVSYPVLYRYKVYWAIVLLLFIFLLGMSQANSEESISLNSYAQDLCATIRIAQAGYYAQNGFYGSAAELVKGTFLDPNFDPWDPAEQKDIVMSWENTESTFTIAFTIHGPLAGETEKYIVDQSGVFMHYGHPSDSLDVKRYTHAKCSWVRRGQAAFYANNGFYGSAAELVEGKVLDPSFAPWDPSEQKNITLTWENTEISYAVTFTIHGPLPGETETYYVDQSGRIKNSGHPSRSLDAWSYANALCSMVRRSQAVYYANNGFYGSAGELVAYKVLDSSFYLWIPEKMKEITMTWENTASTFTITFTVPDSPSGEGGVFSVAESGLIMFDGHLANFATVKIFAHGLSRTVRVAQAAYYAQNGFYGSTEELFEGGFLEKKWEPWNHFEMKHIVMTWKNTANTFSIAFRIPYPPKGELGVFSVDETGLITYDGEPA